MSNVTFTTTNIRLPKSDLRALKIIAAQCGKSLSGLFREIASSFLVDASRAIDDVNQDPIWRWGDKPVKTGDPLLSQKIDEILYGKRK